MTVRYILIATAVILQLNYSVKCSVKVENGEEKQSFVHFNDKYKTLPRVFSYDIGNDLKIRSFPDTSKIKEANTVYNQRTFKRGCENSLCAFFKNHRVIRQAAYSPMYPQLPTSYPIRQPNNTYPYNTHQPNNQYGINPYSPQLKPVVPIIPYQNPTSTRPVYNSTYPNFPNNNMSNNNYQNSRHTYPPSPRPNYNSQPWPNYRVNTTSARFPTNTSYPFNINRPKNFFGNITKPGYPNTYPRSNFTNYNIYNSNNRTQNGYQGAPGNYPQPRPLPSGQSINNSRPNHNGFQTYPTSNYHKNLNGYQTPNGSYYNSNSINYNPHTNYSYGAPVTPKYPNYNGSNSYGSNKNNIHIPVSGINSYPINNNNAYTNNFSQTPNNPYQWTSTNRPQTPYNPNIPQYNAAMEPNHVYYVPNNNASMYDPRKHPPERFSY